MSQPAPAGASCAWHPEVAAAWTCNRCGSFMCSSCERRVRPDATPMCPGCWDLRLRSVPEQKAPSGTVLQTTGLVLGCLSLLPFPAVILASFALNIIAIVKANTPEARRVRWRPIVGLGLTGLSVILWVALVWGRA